MATAPAWYEPPPGYGIPEAPTSPFDGARTSTAPTTTASGDDSALAFIKAQFEKTFGPGFGKAAEAAYQVYLDTDDLYLALANFRASDEYKARFAGLAELRRKGRPISEAAYLDLERSYTQIARQFDLPPTFYDGPEDFSRLIGGEVSPMEFQRRLTAHQAAERASRDTVAAEEINRQLAALGLPPASDGDFLASFIDPGRGIAAIERRLEAASVGAESRRAGYGSLTTDEALGLADLGVDQQRAREGFGALADSQELFTNLAGEEGADTLDRRAQLSLVSATDAASARRLEAQARRRVAQFQGGGGGGVGRSGLAGLG